MSNNKSNKTSLSISKELREVLSIMARLKGTTMEKVVFGVVSQKAQSLIHNPNDITAYIALREPLKLAESEINARYRNSTPRGNRMRMINQARQEVLEKEREELRDNQQRKNRPEPSYNPHTYSNTIHHEYEVSDLTKRRMLGVSVEGGLL